MPLACELTEILGSEIITKDWADCDMVPLFKRVANLMQLCKGAYSQCSETVGLNIEEFFLFLDVVEQVDSFMDEIGHGGKAFDRLRVKLLEPLPVKLTEMEDAITNFGHVERFVNCLKPGDVVVSFNYDTLVERAISLAGSTWNHGMPMEAKIGMPLLKMHGSLDWCLTASNWAAGDSMTLLLSEKGGKQLRRLINRCQLSEMLNGKRKAMHFWGQGWWHVNAGMGLLKQLNSIPGIRNVWSKAFEALTNAESLIIAGFSLAEFDIMAKTLFATARQERADRNFSRQAICIIDPSDDVQAKYRSLFGTIDKTSRRCEEFDWEAI